MIRETPILHACSWLKNEDEEWAIYRNCLLEKYEDNSYPENKYKNSKSTSDFIDHALSTLNNIQIMNLNVHLIIQHVSKRDYA